MFSKVERGSGFEKVLGVGDCGAHGCLPRIKYGVTFLRRDDGEWEAGVTGRKEIRGDGLRMIRLGRGYE